MVTSDGTKRERRSSDPNLSIIHVAMLWIEIKAAVATSPRDSSSKITAASTRPRAMPPCSSPV
ncbi:hypothetical protein D3C80_1307380 [compost metagenome]